MDQHHPQPIAGNVRQCLDHLRDTLKPQSAKLCIRVIDALADFCQVTPRTVKDWLRGPTPIGEKLLRLRFFLRILGYQVEELRKLDGEILQAAELIAFDVCSLESLADQADLSRDHLLEVIRIGGNLGSEYRARIREVHTGKAGALATAFQAMVPVTDLVFPNQTTEQEPDVLVSLSEQQLVYAASHGIVSLVALLRIVQKLPSASRQLLRKQTGNNGIQSLIDLLAKLNVEDATLLGATHKH